MGTCSVFTSLDLRGWIKMFDSKISPVQERPQDYVPPDLVLCPDCAHRRANEKFGNAACRYACTRGMSD